MKGSVEEILSSKSFPWYDAETRGAKPLPFADRPAIRSEDRNSIPQFTPRANPQRAATGVAGPSGAQGESMSFLFWLGLAIVLLSILVLLVWAFLKLESKTQQSARLSSGRSLAESIEQLPFQVDENSGDFRTLAERAYEARNYRKAIIHLYSHVLVVLDQAHLIRLKKGKTNRQYLRELTPQSNLVGYFQQTMESFESVFFGDHEIGRAGFEHCWKQLPSFQAEIERQLVQAREVALGQ